MKHIFLVIGSIIIVGGIHKAGAATLKHQETIKSWKTDNDSISIIQLKKELSKLKPLDSQTFKSKIKNDLDGFILAEVEAYNDPETGSSCTARFTKGEKSVYLIISDGAGKGAGTIADNLIGNLELKQYTQPGSKTSIVKFKGYDAFFDSSMYDEDKFTIIQYLEGKRFYIMAAGTNITLEELKHKLEKFSL